MGKMQGRWSRRHVRINAGFVIGLVAIHSNLVLAQVPQTSTGATLEEIVVTAQKRSESLQQVPISVTALTAAQLESAKMDNPSSLATLIPNLQVNAIAGPAVPVFSLRGISTFSFSFNVSSPVATYVDEVYKGNFPILGIDLYDLERVEVLRGPQGTLYGKNSTGGAINFITRKPGFDTEGYIKVGLGNYDRYEGQGALQFPLIEDRLAARVAFTYTKADGWIKGVNGTPDMQGIDQYGVRVGLLYKASDDFDLLLKYSKSHQNPYNYGVFSRGVGNGIYESFHSLYPASNPHTDYVRTGLRGDQLELDAPARRKQDTDAVALTMNWALNAAVALTSITSWDSGELLSPEESDGTPLKMVELTYFGRTRQITQDLRLSSTTHAPLQYIVGAYYSKAKLHDATEQRLLNDIDVNGDGRLDFLDCLDSFALLQPAGPLPFPACRFGNHFDQDEQSWAVYTDANYALTDALKVRLGLRYTRDKGKQKNLVAQLIGNDGVPLANLIPGDPNNLDASTSRTLDSSEPTGRIGLDYTLSNGNLLYTSYSRGYRSGAFNAQAFFGPDEATPVPPETIDSYEAGIKSEWFDKRLQLNGGMFFYIFRGQQITAIDPVTFTQPFRSIKKSRVQGAELEIVARPVEPLTIRAGVGLLHAKFIDAPLPAANLSGNTLPNAPDLSATLSTVWDAMHFDATTLTLSLDASYASAQFLEPFNVKRLEQSAYTVLDGRLALRSKHDVWEVAVWGKNLTNEIYVSAAVDGMGSLGYDFLYRGAPRTYGVDATYRF